MARLYTPYLLIVVRKKVLRFVRDGGLGFVLYARDTLWDASCSVMALFKHET